MITISRGDVSRESECVVLNSKPYTNLVPRVKSPLAVKLQIRLGSALYLF